MASGACCHLGRDHMNPLLQLDNIRSVLIRQEETIIFALVERAQFRVNAPVYQPGGIAIPDFDGSFVEYLLHGTEVLHAKVRRFQSPDEHPFSADLPGPLLQAIDHGSPLVPNTININARIKALYEEIIVPEICVPGDDEQYGSTAVCDVACLQALSKRIHYGKFVAESKFRSDPATYAACIKVGDAGRLMELITDPAVEEKLLARVRRKAAAYGQDLTEPSGEYKIAPEFVAALYRDHIIPLTKDVEVAYLLQHPVNG
jgi:chorismate mutase